MSRLYLIRRNMESFAGPMTLVEMKDAYKRMAFGLQDEVSGHCGPWVSFDKLEVIKKQYPDVARIVHEDMLAGWGVSEHDGMKLEGEKTKRLKVKSNKSLGLAIVFALIAIAAFVVALLMATNVKVPGMMASKLKDPNAPAGVSVDALQGLIDRRDQPEFERVMDENADDLVQRVQRDRRLDSPWLPYLRHYAFLREGQLQGMSLKLLRGDAPLSAPSECTLKSWRKKWRGAVGKPALSLIADKKLLRNQWARILAWDPYLIRRRAAPGWLAYDNFFVGCLSIADRALGEIVQEIPVAAPDTPAAAEQKALQAVAGRLQWVLEIARDGVSRSPAVAVPGDPLSAWTCYEGAHDLLGLAKCRDVAWGKDAAATFAGVPSMSPTAGGSDLDWRAYDNDRFEINVLRIAIAQRGVPAPELLQELNRGAARLGKVDNFTRFDWRAEQNLIHAVTKQKIPIEKAAESVTPDFPGLSFGS